MLAAILIVVAAASTQATEPSVRQELDSYYGHDRSKELINLEPAHLQEQLDKYNQKPKEAPSWDASMKQLSSSSAADRQIAAGHLLEVMDQCWKDEQSGKAAWRATPYWGESGENPARQLRASIVDAMEKAPAAAELIPLIRWVLRNEAQFNLQQTSAGVLGKIDGTAAEDYRRELVAEPHPNAFVVGMALDQLSQRKTSLPADELKALCQHHRQVVREAARRSNVALSGPDPGPFNATVAFKSPTVRKIMDELEAMMIDLPAPDAEFVEITIRYMDKDQVKETGKSQGWLIKQDASSATIYTPYGRYETCTDNEPAKIWQSEKTDDGVRERQIDVTTSISVAKPGIDGYVKQIVDVCAKGNKDFELSSRGGLTGQFEGQGASLPEMILSAWLDRGGKTDLAASILLPALDTLYEDHLIVDLARNRLGEILGYRMLVAFDGDRDFEQALKLARALVEHYPNTRFYQYAQGFCDQLPRRMDDFKTFKLPTPAEWAEMKAKLSRQQQIDFLCQRLRLLNCFQWGQPGGYQPSDTQYAEPCGLSDNAAWSQNKGKTVVINPLVELAGNRDGFVPEGQQASKGLELTIADIPALAPYLRDDWYELIVSFWRDFAADRYLGGTRSEIAELINSLARRDICEAGKFASMSAAGKEEQIRKIAAWAEANQHKSDEELVVERVQAEVDRKADWRQVEGYIDELVKLKSPRAIGFVEHYLGDQDQDGWIIPAMLDDMQALDKPKAVGWARKFLTHKEARLRLQSAPLVLESGDKETAIPVLATTLPVGSGEDFGRMAARAVDELLNDGSPEATKAAVGVLLNPGMQRPDAFENFGEHLRAPIVARLAKAGHPEGYKLYLDLLDVKGTQLGQTSYGEPPAKQAVTEILETVGKDDPVVQKARDIKDFEAQRLAVRQWVEAKIK